MRQNKMLAQKGLFSKLKFEGNNTSYSLVEIQM